MKITDLTFQRNGVHGNGFYHCLASTEYSSNMLITFETDDDDNINIRTCRAVDINDLSKRFRGDEIAFELNEHISLLKRVKNCNLHRLSEII